MNPVATAQQQEVFYKAALLGLRALEAREREPRRFGRDADLRWDSFRGHLGTSDRLDILVRDAAVRWGAAFSPAIVFDLPGLALDEPFGPDWTGLVEHVAQRLWKADSTPPSVVACADALGVNTTPVSIPELTASTRLVVAGGAAICTVGSAFAGSRDLSWSDQGLVVADRPAERQLAGLVAALVNTAAQTRLTHAMADAQDVDWKDIARVLGEVGFAPGGRAVISDDATDSERQLALRITRGA